MVVRSGTQKVSVVVPPAWRSRVAVTWGSARGGQISVAFEACKNSHTRWFAYAGGFYLDSPIDVCSVGREDRQPQQHRAGRPRHPVRVTPQV